MTWTPLTRRPPADFTGLCRKCGELPTRGSVCELKALPGWKPGCPLNPKMQENELDEDASAPDADPPAVCHTAGSATRRDRHRRGDITAA